MFVIYNIGLRMYYGLIRLASLINLKARRFVKGRKTIYSEDFKEFCEIKKDCAWFHCSSMGEYEDGKMLIEICLSDPRYKVLVTFSSPTGYDYHKPKHKRAFISYLPYDYPAHMQRFIDYVNPAKLILCRNDIWPNLITCAQKKAVPLYLVDYAIQSPELVYFPLRRFYRPLFRRFKAIFAQSQPAAKLMQHMLSLGNVLVGGHTRFDAIEDNNGMTHAGLQAFIDERFVLLLGSALKKDLELLSSFSADLLRQIKIIAVEHEPSDSGYEELKKQVALVCVKWSDLEKSPLAAKGCNLLYVDTVGILKKLYFSSNLAHVGGGFDKIGIHNILEPAIAANFIAFGPNHRNYIEALDLLQLGECRQVRDSNELQSYVRECIQKNARALKNKNYVLERKGVSEKIYQQIFD